MVLIKSLQELFGRKVITLCLYLLKNKLPAGNIVTTSTWED